MAAWQRQVDVFENFFAKSITLFAARLPARVLTTLFRSVTRFKAFDTWYQTSVKWRGSSEGDQLTVVTDIGVTLLQAGVAARLQAFSTLNVAASFWRILDEVVRGGNVYRGFWVSRAT